MMPFLRRILGYDVPEKAREQDERDMDKRQQMQEIRTRLQVIREQLDMIERRKVARN